jgi:MoaA/NifB/PqqE/SkfB family radical SAM enzyme
MKAMLNITWHCNLDSCPYCWVRQRVVNRQEQPEIAWDEWRTVLLREKRITHIDFVGGEPLIYPGFHSLVMDISQQKTWAVTTNLASDGYLPFLEHPLPRCQAFTCSWHPSSKTPVSAFTERVALLNKIYPTSINILENASKALEYEQQFREMGFNVFVSPYENIRLAKELPRLLTCNGGISHCVLDPVGNVYPCLSLLRRPDSDRFIMGNIFTKVTWHNVRLYCRSYCFDYDVLYQRHHCFDMWGLEIKEEK